MRISARLLLMALMASTLVLAGCSYTPARIRSEPLIEIGGHQGGHHRRAVREYHDHDDDWEYLGRDRDRHYDARRYRDRHRDRDRDHDRHRHRSRFCPPGLEMQGRC